MNTIEIQKCLDNMDIGIRVDSGSEAGDARLEVTHADSFGPSEYHVFPSSDADKVSYGVGSLERSGYSVETISGEGISASYIVGRGFVRQGTI